MSRTGQLILSGLAILAFLQVLLSVASFVVRHQTASLVYFALEAVIMLPLLQTFYVKQAKLLKDGIAATATITRVNNTRVSYSFSVNQVPYGGTVSVAAPPGQIRAGNRVAIVYDPVNPSRSIPITAAALMEIKR
jgi:hypothetical protein